MRAFVIDFKALAASLVLVVSSLALADSVSYIYDSLGRITGATYANGTVIQYAYDANGNRTLQVVAGNQAITFGTAPTVVAGGTGKMSATGGGSGNPVVFTSTTAGICTVTGSTITGVAVGTCTIAANQAGTGSYTAAPQVTQSFNIGKGNQIISLGTTPTLVVGSIGSVSATGGTSGNPVIFTSTTPAVCAITQYIAQYIVSGLTAGTCSLSVNQSGNANYNAATPVTQTFSISKANQAISFGTTPTVNVGGTGILSATGGASGNPIVFTSTTPSICTVSGSTVTGVKVGNCTIAANQAGNANYNAAVQATKSFSVTVPPPQFALNVSNANVTFGTVSSSVGGIVCGTTCSANFASGTNVTLTAIPISGYQFAGWGGACHGYGNSCTLTTTNAAQTVTANFAVFKIHHPLWKQAIGSIVKIGE